jgi:hypothetical protein
MLNPDSVLPWSLVYSISGPDKEPVATMGAIHNKKSGVVIEKLQGGCLLYRANFQQNKERP